MTERADLVFKALADPTRRLLLDRLRETDGQTLGQLCAALDIRRQSVTQHLDLLEGASLVTTIRRGREKLHYLNPVPIHEAQERWIGRFDTPRLRALSAIKHTSERVTAVTTSPDYLYVTYIQSSAEEVWHALTDADLTAAYWGHSNVSTWEPGARWEHRRTDGSGIADVVGRVLVADPPHRLVITFGSPIDPEAAAATVTFTLTPHEDIVRLVVVHEGLASDEDREAALLGWSAVGANLKSLLETGSVLPQAPWEIHADLSQAQMAHTDRH